MRQVIVDQGNKAGFDCVAHARDELLSLGKRAAEQGYKGAHVVAPVSLLPRSA